jgi:hypothetical protein
MNHSQYRRLTLVFFITSVVVSGISFASSFLINYYLKSDEFIKYSQYQNLSIVLVNLIGFGMPSVLITFKRNIELTVFSNLLSIVLIVLLPILALFSALLISLFFVNELIIIYSIVFYSLSQAYLTIVLALDQIERKFMNFFIVSTANSLVLLCSLSGLIYFDFELTAFYYTQGAFAFLIFFTRYTKFYKRWPIICNLDKQVNMKDFIWKGFLAAMQTFLFSLLLSFDKIFLPIIFPSYNIDYFYKAYLVLLLPMFVINVFANTWGIKAIEEIENINVMLFLNGKIKYWKYILIVVVFNLLLAFLFGLHFDIKDHEMYLRYFMVVVFSSIGLVFIIYNKLIFGLLTGLKRFDLIVISNIATLIFYSLCAFLFIWFGLEIRIYPLVFTAVFAFQFIFLYLLIRSSVSNSGN